jgi:NAD(P)-dependent dehydrogenase (short-subunit alcohol dehydrogenase family)
MTEAGTAVVVGATGALGAAIVQRLRAARLIVVAVARDATPLARLAEADPGVLACPADISEAASHDAIAHTSAAPVRMVVQATGLPPAGPLERIDPDALGAAVVLKVGGLLRLARAVDDRLAAGSRIVALGGHFGSEPAPHACAAGVVNAGLANLVRQLSDAYGPRGVTVHLVAPGPVDTPRLRSLAETAAASRGVPVDSVLEEYRAHSPRGQLTSVEEVSWAVAQLLAPEAGALNGATLALDGGARRGLF